MGNENYAEQVLNYACMETQKKYQNKNQTIAAVYRYVLNKDASCFTGDNEARDYISKLSQAEVASEILKNIVKINSAKGHRCMLRCDKDFKDIKTQQEVEAKMYEALKNMEIVSIENILSRYPDLYPQMVYSFVITRYVDPSLGYDKLDQDYKFSDYDCQLIYKIDEYYNSLRQNKNRK